MLLSARHIRAAFLNIPETGRKSHLYGKICRHAPITAGVPFWNPPPPQIAETADMDKYLFTVQGPSFTLRRGEDVCPHPLLG